MSTELKVFRCTDNDWYAAVSAEQATELLLEMTDEGPEEGYPEEMTDAQLDEPIPEFNEDDQLTGEMTDSETLDALFQKYRERERIGVEKYGTTVDRTDLSLRDWLQHALEESMDHCLYLMRAIKKEDEREVREAMNQHRGNPEFPPCT